MNLSQDTRNSSLELDLFRNVRLFLLWENRRPRQTTAIRRSLEVMVDMLILFLQATTKTHWLRHTFDGCLSHDEAEDLLTDT